MMKKLWARITNKSDETGQYPVQQATYLGRVADFFTLFPYGMHANLPKDQLGLIIDEQGRVFMGTSAVGRILVEEGEVVFYHPQTKSKTIYKNNGDIDMDSVADINLKANNVNIDASVTNLGVGGQPIARQGDAVSVSPTTHVGTITGGGNNTSI